MAESKLAVLAALAANLAIAIVKLVAGLVATSATMLAEAAHSFSDVGNQVLLLVGISRASKPPSPRHPFGTSKAAYFWPFMVAILLFGVAGAYSFMEGITKILHPHPVGNILLSLGVLAGAFLLEVGSILVALRQARTSARQRGITSVRQFLDENRDASLLTVLVEDTLALVSLPVAAAALLLAEATGHPVWDGIGSLIIGALLMGFAVFLGDQVQRLLIGRGLTDRDAALAMEIFANEPMVVSVTTLKTMYLGPDVILLGAELEMRADVAGHEVTTALATVENKLIAAIPHLRFVFLEPHAMAPRALAPPGTIVR